MLEVCAPPGNDHDQEVGVFVDKSVKVMLEPIVTDVLLAEKLATGVWLIITLVVPAELVHPLTVAVTEYVPAMAVVALLLTVGFCVDEV